jgi:hypothetical protein
MASRAGNSPLSRPAVLRGLGKPAGDPQPAGRLPVSIGTAKAVAIWLMMSPIVA